MSFFIKPLDRIRQLERENSRLRALVGEAPAVEQPETGMNGAEAPEPATLVQKTTDLETAVGLIAEVML
jgi:hypothetical protein